MVCLCRELKRDNYRLKLDVEELNKKIAELEKPKEAEVEIVPVYSEPDDEDTQKRSAAEQAGPSSRKKHKLAGLAFGNPQVDHLHRWMTVLRLFDRRMRQQRHGGKNGKYHKLNCPH